MSIFEILTTAVLFVLMMAFFVVAGVLGTIAFHYVGEWILEVAYPVKGDGKH